MSNETVIKHTKNWINDVVVKLNFCPFAQFEVQKGSINYRVFEGADEITMLTALLEEYEVLDSNDKVETSFLIFPTQFPLFEKYLDFVDMANALMEDKGYEGVYQLATFHPEYCFHGEDKNDASNFTNRSPYPMLHILRESTLEYVLENFTKTEAIPMRNIELSRELGAEYFLEVLKSCTKNKKL